MSYFYSIKNRLYSHLISWLWGLGWVRIEEYIQEYNHHIHYKNLYEELAENMTGLNETNVVLAKRLDDMRIKHDDYTDEARKQRQWYAYKQPEGLIKRD